MGVMLIHCSAVQRTPREGKKFASFWIGARMADWNGDGRYDLVSHGPKLTKRHPKWWYVPKIFTIGICTRFSSPESSPLGQEPNYLGLKTSPERQECVALAVFSDGMVCMHDWFCSWATHFICELRE